MEKFFWEIGLKRSSKVLIKTFHIFFQTLLKIVNFIYSFSKNLAEPQLRIGQNLKFTIMKLN
jgi:hypothetical protein